MSVREADASSVSPGIEVITNKYARGAGDGVHVTAVARAAGFSLTLKSVPRAYAPGFMLEPASRVIASALQVARGRSRTLSCARILKVQLYY
jgi:hypothetical protein